MILDALIGIAENLIGIILLPLSLLEVTVDFLASIPIVFQFIQVVAYFIPWANILPVIIFIIGITIFRTTLAIINLIWHFIPFIGN